MNDWSEAERHAQRAQRFYQAGQWSRAVDELRLALSYNPYQSDWYLGMALALDALHRYREAAQAYEQALRLRGDEDTDTMLRWAADLIRSQQPKRAVEVLQRVAEIDPQCEPAYCQQILAHALLGNHDEAQVMFYMARQIVDECPACYDYMAHSLAMQGDWERAIWCWQQTLRLDARHPDIHANLAAAHWGLGRLELARRDFLRHLRRRPGDVRALIDLGRLLIEMGRWDQACQKLRQAIDLDPQRAEAHALLGQVALGQNHLDAAQGSLERACQLDPQRPGLHLALAQVAYRRGDRDEAGRLVQQERMCRGRTAHQTIDLARLMLDLDQPAEATATLTPLIEGSGEEASKLEDRRQLGTALFLRGVGHLLSGRMGQGIADCRRSLRDLPDNAAAHHNLALAYLRVGRLRRAAACLRRAQRLMPQASSLRRLQHHLRKRFWLSRCRQWRSTLTAALLRLLPFRRAI